MNWVFDTARMRLREFELDDAPALYRLRSEPEIIRYTGEPDAGSCEFDGRVVGVAGLQYVDELDEADVGYRFLKEFWGRGLATEATQACLDYGFSTLGLKRIIALILPPNTTSIRVAQKCGMVGEGMTRCYGKRPVVWGSSLACFVAQR